MAIAATHDSSHLTYSEGRQPLRAVLHLSHKLGELMLCRGDSAVNIECNIPAHSSCALDLSVYEQW